MKEVPDFFYNTQFIKQNLGITKKLSNTQKTKIKLWQFITFVRIINNKSYITPSKELLEDIQYFYLGNNILNIVNFTRNSHILKKESIILSYLIRSLAYDIDSIDTKKSIIEKYYNSNLEISSLAKNILIDFQKSLYVTLSKENFIEAYYYLIIFLIHSKHFKFNLDDYFENPIHTITNKKTKKYLKGYDKIKAVLTSYREQTRFTKGFEKQILFMLCYFYKISDNEIYVNLYVMNSNSVFNSHLIKKTITKLYNPELIKFVDEPDNADLIISDVYEGDEYSSKRVYFSNMCNEKDWKRLISTIGELAFKKKFIDN